MTITNNIATDYNEVILPSEDASYPVAPGGLTSYVRGFRVPEGLISDSALINVSVLSEQDLLAFQQVPFTIR